MRILVACEESQAVCIELRKLGHEAFSCDILPCSGGHPEWHIQDDVIKHLTDGWDMMIAFPPCTHLAVSGAKWFEQKRKDGRQQEGIDFFMAMINAPIERIAVENPIGIMSTLYRKPDQIIQPWMFGHPESKATCLWLKNIPKLVETDNVKHIFDSLPKNKQQRLHYLPPTQDRGILRSKTFPGIAKAMATQFTKTDDMSKKKWIREEIIRYLAFLTTREFSGLEMYRTITQRLGIQTYPDTIFRYMRELEEEGRIKYECTNKQKSLYKLISIK